jgi:hypothetical protein
MEGGLLTRDFEGKKSPTNSQEMVLSRSLKDLSSPWGSLGRIYKERKGAGWITSIG